MKKYIIAIIAIISAFMIETTALAQLNRPPVASTGGPYVADLGSAITLDGTGSYSPAGPIVNYSWSIANGVLTVTGASPSLSAAQVDALGVGTHSVSLTVTDSLGGTGTSSTTLKIYDNRPSASFTANPNPAACGQVVQFDGRSSSHGRPDRSIVSYAWEFGDGEIGSGAVVNHVYAAYGSYTALLTVTDNNTPAKTATTTVEVGINQGDLAPVANTGGPYMIDLGSGVTLNGSASSDPNAACGDSIVSYAWDLDNNGVDDAFDATPSLTAEQIAGLGLGVGTYTIRLAVTDTFGKRGTASTTLAIYDNRPFALISANPTSVTGGYPVTFQGSGSYHGRPDRGIVIYEWDFEYSGSFAPDAMGAVVSHTYSVLGTYVAALRVTDNNVPAKTAISTVTITVVTTGPPVASPGGPYIADLGAAVTFDGTGSYNPSGNPIVLYSWSVANGVCTVTGTSPSLTPA
jgi:PKD repeat protein